MTRILSSVILTVFSAVGGEARAPTILPDAQVVPTTSARLPGYTLVTSASPDHVRRSPDGLIDLTDRVKSSVERKAASGHRASGSEILPQTQSGTLDRDYSRGFKPSIVTDASIIPYIGRFSVPAKFADRTAEGTKAGLIFGEYGPDGVPRRNRVMASSESLPVRP